jgi:PhzF family phenazine biosynthesis protein
LDVQRFSAFSDGDLGGNPAGIVLLESFPEPARMQRAAADVGYSETAFAAPDKEGWRVRYFSPESEVPFCGHATIALGAALAIQQGNGKFSLRLNEATITVEGTCADGSLGAALQSPATASGPASAELTATALALFDLSEAELDSRIPPAIAEAGAVHLVLALKDRQRLASMRYDFAAGKKLMNAHGLVTIDLVQAETPQRIHSRNAFASGGVYEDPATGAAAAALAGYLRDLGWPHGGAFSVRQGEDMGMRSLIHVELTDVPGSSVRVFGRVRRLIG